MKKIRVTISKIRNSFYAKIPDIVAKNYEMYMQRLAQEENQKHNEVMAKKQNEVMTKMEKAKDKKQAKKNKVKKSTRVESKKNKYKKRKPAKR